MKEVSKTEIVIAARDRNGRGRQVGEGGEGSCTGDSDMLVEGGGYSGLMVQNFINQNVRNMNIGVSQSLISC